MHCARKGLVLITGVHTSGLVPVVRTILYVWGSTPCKRRSVVRPLGEWVLSAECASRWARARTVVVLRNDVAWLSRRTVVVGVNIRTQEEKSTVRWLRLGGCL